MRTEDRSLRQNQEQGLGPCGERLVLSPTCGRCHQGCPQQICRFGQLWVTETTRVEIRQEMIILRVRHTFLLSCRRLAG